MTDYKKINIVLPEADSLWLDAYAGRSGLSRAEVVRRALKLLQHHDRRHREPADCD